MYFPQVIYRKLKKIGVIAVFALASFDVFAADYYFYIPDTFPSTEKIDAELERWEVMRAIYSRKIEDVSTIFQEHIGRYERKAESYERLTSDAPTASFYRTCASILQKRLDDDKFISLSRVFLEEDDGYKKFLKEARQLALSSAEAGTYQSSFEAYRKLRTEFIDKYGTDHVVFYYFGDKATSRFDGIVPLKYVYDKTAIAVPLFDPSLESPETDRISVEVRPERFETYVRKNVQEILGALYVDIRLGLDDQMGSYVHPANPDNREVPFPTQAIRTYTTLLNGLSDSGQISQLLTNDFPAKEKKPLRVIVQARGILLNRRVIPRYDKSTHTLTIPVLWESRAPEDDRVLLWLYPELWWQDYRLSESPSNAACLEALFKHRR